MIGTHNEMASSAVKVGAVSQRCLGLKVLDNRTVTEFDIGLDACECLVQNQIDDPGNSIRTISRRCAARHNVHTRYQCRRQQIQVNATLQ